MVTNKTTKALSLILPAVLLVSTNVRAEEANSTLTTAAKYIWASANVIVGLGLLKYSWSTNSAAATVKIKDGDKTEVVEVATAKDAKNPLVFASKADATKEVTLVLNDKAELPADLTKENLAKVVKNPKDLEDINFVKSAPRPVMKNTGWVSAIKTNFKPTNLHNATHNIAPFAAGVMLVANGVATIAKETGLTGSEDSAE